MNTPTSLAEILQEIRQSDESKLVCQCPFMQHTLLNKGLITEKELKANLADTPAEETPLEDWLDGQEVMKKLRISLRTLQSLRTSGTLPHSRINNKIYYRKEDIQKVLSNNYVMHKLHNRKVHNQ